MKFMNKARWNLTSRDICKWEIIYLFGLLITMVLYLPLIILNKDALLVIHDQLDGEILSFILNAKHLMNLEIPELFDGVNKSAVTPATPLFVYVYKLFPSWMAFLICYIWTALVAYTGMFLCLKELLNKKWIALSVAIIFAMLPFYPSYGLSIMGQPLLLYSCILLYNNKKIILSYALIFLFSLSSSLILVGYVDIIIMSIVTIYLYIGKDSNRKRLFMGLIILVISYCFLNFNLINEIVFSGETFISHREEVLAQSIPIRTAFWDMLQNGQYHAVSNHKYIYYIGIIVFFCVITGYGQLKEKEKKYFNHFLILGSYTIFVAIFYSVWKFMPIVNIRNLLGGLFVTFQADRFYCLYPAVWYILLAYCLYFISSLWKKRKLRSAAQGIILLIMLLLCQTTWDKSNLRINYKRLKDESFMKTGYASWNEFYAEELFDDLKEYIGKPISEYKVGSIGLYPSIALYNGFHCVDGYSNNYSIEYKHKFRKVIEYELNKNEELKSYYDEWGNRCYLFSSEIPFRYFIGKESQEKLENLQFDFYQLKKIGCEYLFSTLPIENKEDTLVFEKKFETESCPYCVYLYRIR